MLSFTKQDALQKVNFTIFLKSEAGQIKPMQSLQCLHVFLRFCCWFCLRRWASISCLKKSMPSWPCEASFMALDCMHMRYWSGGSSSAQFFSCHRWNKPREGARTTNRLLWRYFLYRWTSSPPQPLMSMSKPPERAKEDHVMSYVNESVGKHISQHVIFPILFTGDMLILSCEHVR